MTRIFAVVFFLVVGYYAVLPRQRARGSTSPCAAAILSIIFLSITVITGFAGQISLCQATFAAIGACRDRAARDRASGMSVLVAMVDRRA